MLQWGRLLVVCMDVSNDMVTCKHTSQLASLLLYLRKLLTLLKELFYSNYYSAEHSHHLDICSFLLLLPATRPPTHAQEKPRPEMRGVGA